MIAGLPQSPSLYNPLQNANAAEERRNEVLDSMADLDYITELEAEDAKGGRDRAEPERPLHRDPRALLLRLRPAAADRGVRRQHRAPGRPEGATRRSTPSSRRPGATRSRTTSTTPPTPRPRSSRSTPPPASSRRWPRAAATRTPQFNLAAQGHRQPGSAFKTFALTTAVRRGIDPDTTYYTSQPLDIDDPEYGHWEVQTYSDSYAGSVNLHQATLASDNTVYAQLALDLGPDSIADTAKDMGIETELDGLPAETLGGLRLGVSPLEITNAYATLASGGIHNKPIAIRKVTFPDGHVDEIGEPDRNRVFEDGVAYEVTQILEDNVDAGTGTAAAPYCGDEAGKTGTTDDFNDAMFVGYTPYLADRRLGRLPRRPAAR